MVIILEGTSSSLSGIDSLSVTARANTYHLIDLKGCQVIHCH